MTLFQTGFRPFFLLAALAAAVALPLWLALLRGLVAAPVGLTGTAWHAHEMLVGYTAAVVAGFLTTAVRNWTGLPTVKGYWLAGLALLWVLGRVGAYTGGVLGAADAVFFGALAVAIGIPIVRTRSRRNWAFPVLLLGMGGADAAWHFGEVDVRTASTLVLDAVVVMMTVVGGRVVPMFTVNALPRSGARRHRTLDAVALVSVGALCVADAALPGSQVAGGLGVLAGIATLVRLSTWGSTHVLSVPLVWVLHLGMAFLGIGLCLRGAAAFELLSVTVGVHVITVGAIGLLTLGMMARVALGHTGRPLLAHWSMAWAFAGIALATVLRAIAGLLTDGGPVLRDVSGSLFSAAFLVYLVVYVPILWRPRADGKPG